MCIVNTGRVPANATYSVLATLDVHKFNFIVFFFFHSLVGSLAC